PPGPTTGCVPMPALSKQRGQNSGGKLAGSSVPHCGHLRPDWLAGEVMFAGGYSELTTLFPRGSASCVRIVRNSRCIWKVTLPTKKKHIGRKAKKAGRHHSA